MNWWIIVSVGLLGIGLIAQGVWVLPQKAFVGAMLVFAGCAAVTHLVPGLGFPWPLLARLQDGHFVTVLSPPESWLVDAVEWSVATVLFGWAFTRWRPRMLVPFAWVGVVTVNLLVHMTVYALGMAFVAKQP
ncbi:MAG: hypothetical protein ABI222_17520 [Opitutaceae bacterium]